MIINSGFNVYPSEVESAMRDMPGVVDVAVVGMPTDTFSEAVVAALVLEPGASVDLDAVRKWTEDKLSHYAMPKSIAILDDLPRSQLGKVLRRNVKDTLANFELVSGQWRERASAASHRTADRIDDYVSAVKERATHAKSSFSALSAQSAPISDDEALQRDASADHSDGPHTSGPVGDDTRADDERD